MTALPLSQSRSDSTTKYQQVIQETSDVSLLNTHDTDEDPKTSQWDLPASTPLLQTPRTLDRGFRKYMIIYPLLPASIRSTIIALWIEIVRLRDHTASESSYRVIQAANLAATLWPLVFAAVVGNTVKTWAQCQVEMGTTIGRLEQLMGSQTVFGTVKTFFLLRSSLPWTAVLISIWAFSPLGSQASLRGAHLASNIAKGTRTHFFQDPRFVYDQSTSWLDGASSWQSARSFVGLLYGASMYNPEAGTQYSNGTSSGYSNLVTRLGGADVAVKVTTQDMWGNVRIPDPASLPAYSESKKAEWFDVPYDSQIIDYVSLIGAPVRGIPTPFIGNTSFVISANYHSFSCSPWLNYSSEGQDIQNWMRLNYANLSIHYNASLDQAPWDKALASMFPPWYPGGFFVDRNGNMSGDISSLEGVNAIASQDSVVFGSRSDQRIYITTCAVNMNYVDVNVSCAQVAGSSEHLRCVPSRIRISTDASFNKNVTAWSVKPFFYNIVRSWPTILSPTQHVSTSTETERFITDPAAFFNDNATMIGAVEVGATPIDVFAKRFGLLFNTLWKASVNPNFITGGNYTIGDRERPLINTTAQWSSPMPDTYVLDRAWIGIFLTSILVLLLAAVSSLVLRLRPHVPAPEILGYVSSLTRDSPFMDLAVGMGSALSGEERALLLRNRRVRLVDVQGKEDFGRVALAEVGARTAAVAELRRGRLYM